VKGEVVHDVADRYRLSIQYSMAVSLPEVGGFVLYTSTEHQYAILRCF